MVYTYGLLGAHSSNIHACITRSGGRRGGEGGEGAHNHIITVSYQPTSYHNMMHGGAVPCHDGAIYYTYSSTVE